MDYQNVLSNEFRDLDLIAKKEKEKYISAYPFSHITIKNFFNNDFLSQVLNDFPDLSKLHATQNYNNQNEIKFANNKYDNFSDKFKKGKPHGAFKWKMKSGSIKIMVFS